MKTIVFSDTHLSSRMYRKKYLYLRSVIEQADRVVILGDLWDGFLTTFEAFLRSGWSKLFPLLLEREAVYLYGNHDRMEWSDERVGQFSVAHGNDIELTLVGKQFYFVHGHSIKASLEEQHPALNRSVPLRLGSSVDVLHKLVWGRRFLNATKDINQPMIEWGKKHLPPETILVCGHTHYPELELEQGFINDGFIGCGFGNYLSISDDGIELVKETY